ARQPTPVRCLACLSSRMPRVRLTAARALECFADGDAFRRFVVDLFNDRGDDPPWKVPPQTVETVAELLVHGTPPIRARTALLLRHLSEKEQAAWNQAWNVHEDRFAPEIAAWKQQAGQHPPAPSRYNHAQLLQLAFGAYVGLVREQGGAPERGRASSPGSLVVRVRQTALARLLALASGNSEYAAQARPVLVQALGDPNQAVRLQAFEHLQTLGMDRTALGAEALEAGHTDLGVKGLELLSGGAAGRQGQAVLEQVMQARNDALAVEAAKLLIDHRGTVPVAFQALGAAHEALRQQAVLWLAAEYDTDESARKHLREALNSRYQKVRNQAALQLA